MTYTRSTPSPRYTQLVDFYKQMHDAGTGKLQASETFDGASLVPHIARIRMVIQEFRSKTLLDYGSGKGSYYQKKSFPVAGGKKLGSLQQYWGLQHLHLYDPGYPPLAILPDEVFDGVICTDVMEHIPEEDMDWVVDELLGYGRHFVYACIALYPAEKTFPDGSNVHVTLKDPKWWVECWERRRQVMLARDGKAPHYYLIFFASAGDGNPLALTSKR